MVQIASRSKRQHQQQQQLHLQPSITVRTKQPNNKDRRIERILSFLGILNLVGIVIIIYKDQPNPSLPLPLYQHLQHDHGNGNNQSIDYHLDQESTLSKLRDLGVSISDPAIRKKLPPWWKIQQQFGNAPRILGLERCHHYRQTTQQLLLGPSGLFNTGTNLLSQLLQNNCVLPQSQSSPHFFAFQAPWGKHTPADYRGKYTIPHVHYQAMHVPNVLPIVTIRHPYDWMKSTCRIPYAVEWSHDYNHCPNLVHPFTNTTIPVTVHFGVGNLTYPTLLHLWNQWYRQYYDSISYPRLVLRMEDLLFYPKETITSICDCVGGTMNTNTSTSSSSTTTTDTLPFQVLMESAKGYASGHGTVKTGLVDAWIKYGTGRTYQGFSALDQHASQEIVDKDIMNYFGYIVDFSK